MLASSTDVNIRVVCRFRPQNSREINEGGSIVVSLGDDDDPPTTVQVNSKDYPGTFAFDRVFDWTANQKQVFDYAAAQIVDGIAILCVLCASKLRLQT
jgi:kinesin family protein 5